MSKIFFQAQFLINALASASDLKTTPPTNKFTIFTFDSDDDDDHHQICKCINFFVFQPIFFNDPSKFA